MDEQNNGSWWDGGSQAQDNKLDGGQEQNKIVTTPGVNKKKRTWLYIVGVLCGILVIGGGVFGVLYLINQGQKGETADGSGSVAVNNTELKGGSVTTTIGGKSVTYTATYVVDGVEATISSGTYASAKDDENVFLVINGGSLVIDGNVTVEKSGSEDFQGRGDDYSFYGTNSAIVVVGDGSSATINGAAIKTEVSGANAVVATNGGVVGISDSTIVTTKDNSRGLHATYKGAIEADDVKITTQGGSCAALATDRGEGTVIANGMTLSTAGAGSPLIYSTGKIEVSDSTGTATGAQIAVVEGKNSVSLENCNFSTNGNGNRNGVDNAGVMIYQSMSGDAGGGTGSFVARASTLTVLADSSVYMTTPFFFVTNTMAMIDLNDVALNFSDASYLISAVGTSEWGQVGNNGGKVTITETNMTATNTLTNVDAISSVSGL